MTGVSSKECVCVCVCVLLWDKFSCSPSWSQTHYVTDSGLDSWSVCFLEYHHTQLVCGGGILFWGVMLLFLFPETKSHIAQATLSLWSQGCLWTDLPSILPKCRVYRYVPPDLIFFYVTGDQTKGFTYSGQALANWATSLTPYIWVSARSL